VPAGSVLFFCLLSSVFCLLSSVFCLLTPGGPPNSSRLDQMVDPLDRRVEERLPKAAPLPATTNAISLFIN